MERPPPTYAFASSVWRAPGDAAWHFVTLPPDVSDDIRARSHGGDRPGFGSVSVRVRVGGSRWDTSVFPDSRSGCYVLPLKKPVRRAEGLEEGDEVEVEVTPR
ncbi:DUF1905 domain-containing protein [Mumia sp. DW29H23]|uniref:DUF1905 domain-containing protein n=1 Tax=Mumia sp. DW29H23 TaxID=3421241 RepID=UPI003D688031